MNKRTFYFVSSVLLAAMVLATLAYLSVGARRVYAAIHPKVVTSFSSPGGQVSGLAWGDNSLWLVDENRHVYRLSADGIVQGTFTTTLYATDLSWFENSLWVHDGNNVYQLNSLGQISSTLDVGYWSFSGMEWAEGYLYVNDYNSGRVYKHDRQGNQLLSWDTNFFGHPEGMTYDGSALWIGDSCEGENGLWRYSLQGVELDMIDLDTVEPCDYTSNRALAWDGQYLWYAGKFTVYRIDITGLFADTDAGMTGVTASQSAWGDYDSDGDLDLAVIGQVGSTASTKIYRNDGNHVFTDINATVANLYSGSVDWGDYNNDGHLDLLLTGCADTSCSTRTTRIYRGLGNGSFSNVVNPGLLGVALSDAAWGDYDHDGDLDILLLGHTGSAGATRIYRNNGNDTFTALSVNMKHVYGPGLFELYNGAVAWGDYDNDGNLDALLTGCYTATCYQTAIDIYHNDGNDTFTLAFTGGGARYSAVAWGDYDNDGDLDILLTGSMGWAASEMCKTIIYRNDSGTDFVNIDALLPGACQGSADWGDYDNDGDLDIVMAGDTIPNGYNSKVSQVYRNDGEGTFTDIQASLKDIYIGSATWGDYDRDNDLDISLTGSGFARVYRNVITTTNTVPTAPSGLNSAPCSALSCNVTWSASSDDHTPASGLTYNIRVGTTPGGVDVVAPMAITGTAVLTNAGYRFIPQMGNVGQMLGFQVSGLDPETTYYWSVQAVDTAYLGSPFSTEATFTTGSLSRVYLPVVIR